MNASILKTRTLVTTARFVVLAGAALALAACETDGTGPTAADAPKAEVASAKPDAAGPKTEVFENRSEAAGGQTRGAGRR